MTNHPYTPSPTELPGLLSGEVTEVWVRMDKQPYSFYNGRPYKKVRETISVYETPIIPPYAVGDVLVVLEEWIVRGRWTDDKSDMDVRINPGHYQVWTKRSCCFEDGSERFNLEEFGKVRPADTMPHWSSRLSLTITAVTPQQRDGVWGWGITTTKGNDDE